jgi:hypothetical protein
LKYDVAVKVAPRVIRITPIIASLEFVFNPPSKEALPYLQLTDYLSIVESSIAPSLSKKQEL